VSATIVAAFVLCLLPTGASAYSAADLAGETAAYAIAVNSLVEVLENPAAKPVDVVDALFLAQEVATVTRGNLAALDPEDEEQRAVQKALLEGVDDRIQLLDEYLAGKVSHEQFITRWNAISARGLSWREQIEGSSGEPEGGYVVKGEDDGHVAEPVQTTEGSSIWTKAKETLPLDRWWFWLLAPEVLGLGVALVWWVVIAPLIVAAEAIKRRRHRG
jgi:hypothetical protein